MATKVIIGVDPHKTTHTAVAVDDKESQLGKLEPDPHGVSPPRTPCRARSRRINQEDQGR